MNNLKEAAKGEDGDAIKKAMENLSTAAQELGKVLYEEAAKQQAAQGGAAADGAAGADAPGADENVKRKGGDDVIDAEFEAKDK